MTRLSIGLALALCVLGSPVRADDPCEHFGECSRSGQEADVADGKKIGTVNGLTTAFAVADGGNGGPDNGKFNGVQDRIDELKPFKDRCHDTADQVDDNRDPEHGATAGQVEDMKAQFQGVIDKINEKKSFLTGKRDELKAIDQAPMDDDHARPLRDMITRIEEFISKYENGINRMASARNAVSVGLKEDQCKEKADEIKKLIEDDLEPARDHLNDTIDPLKEQKRNAVEDYARFQCECSGTLASFRDQRNQAQITELQRQLDETRAALQAAGIPLPEGTAPQTSIDDVGGAPGASAPAGSPPAGSPPAGSPPAPGAPRGRQLSEAEAQGGLGAIAFANCAQMGYDCSPSAIYGPGGMVSVLQANITNRSATNPNLIFTGDTIDFDAVDLANN